MINTDGKLSIRLKQEHNKKNNTYTHIFPGKTENVKSRNKNKAGFMRLLLRFSSIFHFEILLKDLPIHGKSCQSPRIHL